MKPKLLTYIAFTIIVLSFIGISSSVYLTVQYYIHAAKIFCLIVEGCDLVLLSQYATVTRFDIPVSLGGVLYYFAVLGIAITYLVVKNIRILSLIFPLTGVAFGASVWFVYLQLFVIEAICIQCTLSALIITILFVLSLIIAKYRSQKKLKEVK